MGTQGIRSDPAVMMGKPVVEGTRIAVESILEELGAGQTIEDLLEAHPRLTREGILAAVRFGAQVLCADITYPATKSVAWSYSPAKVSMRRSSPAYVRGPDVVCVAEPSPSITDEAVLELANGDERILACD